MKLRIVSVLLLASACGEIGQTQIQPDAGAQPVQDAGSRSDATAPSSGPCYSDPSSTLRFADQATVTQSDGTDCYAIYTVTTWYTKLQCPCMEQAACDTALKQLTAEADACPPLRD